MTGFVQGDAGIAFQGWDPTTSSLIAEAQVAEQPELGTRNDHRGTHGIRQGGARWVFADEGPVRLMLAEPTSACRTR